MLFRSHKSRMTGKRKNARTHVTFCSFGTNRSYLCTVWLQGMKSELILTISSAKYHGYTKAHHPHRRQNRISLAECLALCLVRTKDRGLV